jgi:hypothetical protein
VVGDDAHLECAPASRRDFTRSHRPRRARRPGTYSFAVISPATDTNGTHFFSKEGSATNAAYLKLSYVTVDGDGDGTPDGPDCDDADPAVHPGVAEQCNGHDDNCDGIIDEGCGTSGSGGWGGSNDEEASGCAQSQSPRAPRTGWFLAGLALVLLGAARRQRGLPEDKALDS